MNGYIQTAIGIFVSIFLFFITYRQTIGAKKERAKNANSSIIRIMMRRIVLEDYTPVYKDISRFIEGKAREFQVSLNDIYSEEVFLNSLYTEVFDSDLISPNQRTNIEKKLSVVLDDIEKEPLNKKLLEFHNIKQEKESKKEESIVLMVISTSVLGALTSTLYSFYTTNLFDPNVILPAVVVLFSSISILTVLITYRKSKEVDVPLSRLSTSILASEFEADIADILKQNNFSFSIEPNLDGLRPDFLVNVNNREIAIEVKSWNGNVPSSILRRTISHLHTLASRETVNEVILVVRKKDGIPIDILNDEKISVLSKDELVNKLKSTA